jgi:membrane-associated phospholipid phosphatase
LDEGPAQVKAGGEAINDGSFTLPVTLTSPVTHLRITASDPRGRVLSTERVVRRGDAVAAWNAALLETIRESTSPSTTVPGLLIKPPPPMVARSLAMVHGALFEAINAVDQQYQGTLLDATPRASASAIAAGATAAHRVAASLYDSAHAMTLWDQTLAEIMATVPEGVSKTLGIELGNQAADAMLAQRANDGSSAPEAYTPGTAPGQWRPSAPGYSPATLPQWPAVTPFAISSGSQFRPASPPPLNSPDYAVAVDEVQRLGSLDSTERSVDQTNIAKFWADAGGTSTPPGHWNQIAIDVGLDQRLPLLENARMMALLNYALADAGLASWDAKYAYNMWRPIDAIRLADSDGNPHTSSVASWTPLLNTPSFPTYTSGHSTFSAAAATVLSDLFGDNFAFSTRADRGSSGVWPPSDDIASLAVREFTSFQQAAEEAGLSRVYGGIHFRFDNTAGQEAGRQVGQWVIDSLLAPR